MTQQRGEIKNTAGADFSFQIKNGLFYLRDNRTGYTFGPFEGSEEQAKNLARRLRLATSLIALPKPAAQSPKDMNAELAWQICEDTAKAWGVHETWLKSQGWDHFQKAWDAWLSAFEDFLCKQEPTLQGKLGHGVPLREFRQAIFLLGLSAGKGTEPDWYRDHAWVLFLAALDGNADFFKRFSEARQHKSDPRQLKYHLLVSWMIAGLWSATNKASAEFILKHFNFRLRHGTTGSVRQAWIDLKLWHNPKPAIKGWIWIENGQKLKAPKPVFYPQRVKV